MWRQDKTGVANERQLQVEKALWPDDRSKDTPTSAWQIHKFADTPMSAWSIIDKAVSGNPNHPPLSEELHYLRVDLSFPGEGLLLLMEELIEKWETMFREFWDAIRQGCTELSHGLATQLERLRQGLVDAFERLEKMKVPLGTHLRMIFTFCKQDFVSALVQNIWIISDSKYL